MRIFKTFQTIRYPKPRTIFPSNAKTLFKLKITLLFLALMTALILSGAGNVQAQTVYYVREGATGANNGSNWTNAYTSLPSTLIRGATYYIADGSYGNYTFDDAVSGSTYIYIKKATASAHGTDTGWLSSYGDGQAVFGSLVFKTGYYVVDGQVGGGPGSWTSGHGFKVYYSGTGYAITVSGVSNVTLAHIEVSGADRTTNTCQRGLYGTGASDITISYCNFYNHYKGLIDLVYSNNIIVEYTKIGPNGVANASDGCHSFGTSWRNNVNVDLRYNLFEDISETGHICMVNDSAGEVLTNFKVYGNIFWESRTLANSGNSIFINFGRSNTKITDFGFYNNTIANFNGWSNAGIYSIAINGGGNVIQNNIWYNNVANTIGFPAGWTHTYNYYNSNTNTSGSSINASETDGQIATGNPFRNMGDRDFRLVGGTASGTPLSYPYAIDLIGKTRGKDGTWDRGAYENGSGVLPPFNFKIATK